MSVKVNVPKERMTPALNDVHNEMNDTKGVKGDELDSSNDSRLFFVIAQQTR